MTHYNYSQKMLDAHQPRPDELHNNEPFKESPNPSKSRSAWLPTLWMVIEVSPYSRFTPGATFFGFTRHAGTAVSQWSSRNTWGGGIPISWLPKQTPLRGMLVTFSSCFWCANVQHRNTELEHQRVHARGVGGINAWRASAKNNPNRFPSQVFELLGTR